VKIKSFLEKIDAINIYEKDYDTLLNLMNNADSRLFVKILEEFVNGKLDLSTFEKVFSDDSYGLMISQNLEVQANLKKEIERLVMYRRDTLGEQFFLNPEETGLGIPSNHSTVFENITDFYNSIKGDNTDELLYQLFSNSELDDDITRAIKAKIYSEVSLSGDNGKLLFYSNEYIVPMDPRYQILNKSDEVFMRENNISEEQMKKIKALSAYLRRGAFIL
jgi:hypothetical protein